jgi:hypothetical protein
MALRAARERHATVADLRAGAYLAGRNRLWFVVAYLEDDNEVVIEDCAKPDDEAKIWTPRRFVSVWGPLKVIRPPRLTGPILS